MPRTTLQQFFQSHLPEKLDDPIDAEAFAPSNIALAKYWGKRDVEFNLPLNSSLSISLAELGSTTQIAASSTGIDEVYFQHTQLESDDPFSKKIINFVNLFRRDQEIPLKITSTNTIPTAAGLASSASGFAALTLAINSAFRLGLSPSILSVFARVGSGSASRSLWHGFVRWNKGQRPDGSDSFAEKIDVIWPEFRIAIVPIDTGPKSMSSTEGMMHTVNTSPLYESWPAQAERDFQTLFQAVQKKDFQCLGEIAEANSQAMHATMLAARPMLNYLKPETWKTLEKVRAARKAGNYIYSTMDAGANVKLIFLKDNASVVSGLFPQAILISPF